MHNYVEGLEQIFAYFPGLTAHQRTLLENLGSLYTDLNQRVNVISRKDIAHIYTHHVLHSLAIARFITFASDSEVMDFGTGGGFPGIPLAILYPQVRFYLVDASLKKVGIVQEVTAKLGLTNVEAVHARGEKWKQPVDFVVCRAVAPLQQLIAWSRANIRSQNSNPIRNGLIALKGGALDDELERVQYPVTVTSISTYFNESFFHDKKVVHVAMQ